MKKQRLTETQIVSILKQYDGGRDPMERCREFGISKATLYNWRKKYAGMDASHFKEMKALRGGLINTTISFAWRANAGDAGVCCEFIGR